MEHSDLVCVKRVKGKGRGVFARKAIAAGQVIEKAPVILIPYKAFVGGEADPSRRKYFFMWSKKDCALVQGYGAIYNHSYTPNARYQHGPLVLSFIALRAIEPGEEITVNYNYDPACQDPMDFEVV